MIKFLAKFFNDERREPGPHEHRPQAATSAVLRKASKKPALPSPPPARPLFTLEEEPSDDHDEHFDPYNTGVFDRGASWNRVGKRHL